MIEKYVGHKVHSQHCFTYSDWSPSPFFEFSRRTDTTTVIIAFPHLES